MKHRSLLALTLITLAVVGPRVQAAATVPLIVQEALYPGSMPGLTRTAEPVSVGIPLPDDAATGATEISQLTLTGAPAGQFRVLGRWPSGRIKWVLVDTLAALSAGGTATGIALTTGGSGNFGGSDIATDNGATITVATGAATFTIRKANFNGFDQVVVGGKTVVAAGTSAGLVLTGPAAGGTTCGACGTAYSSVYDAASTAVIEENGPVRTVIRATGTHKDASGNPYMRFTVRMHFYKGQTRVKATVTLRNADLGGSNSFASAYKGLAAYEWRTKANISGTNIFEIAKQGGTVQTGTLTGSDEVYIYQAKSDLMKADNWDSVSPQYTDDSGYDIRRNGASLATGTSAADQASGGWGDIRDSSGAGMSIGAYQLSAYWPKSLEFGAGGSDVRIGLWPRQNTRFYHQAWPQWSSHDVYFTFHDAALSAPANEFLKFQHYLVGRASYTHYNSTGVFPWPLVDPATEQNWYQSVGAAAVPALSPSSAWPYRDHGTSNALLFIHRARVWGQGGGENQMELRWGYLMNFLSRGMTGRYLQAAHFYRFQTDDVFPHSDGFRWRDQPSAIEPGYGRPSATSLNSTQAFRSWIDSQHQHWSGMLDYYFLTGDELVKEAILDGPLDQYTTANTYGTDLGLLGASREVGARLTGYARLYTFLNAIGQAAEATTVINYGTTVFEKQVKPDALCAASDAAVLGCTTPSYPWTPDGAFDGTSSLRGIHWAGGGYGEWCGVSGAQRAHGPLQTGILVGGLLEFLAVKGPGWSDYWVAKDLAYGMARSILGEAYYENGSGRWDQQGFWAGVLLDKVSKCPPPATEDDHLVEARTTIWALFSALYQTEGTLANYQDELNILVQKVMGALNTNWGENGSYAVTHLVHALNNPGPVLQDVPFTITPNGGGSYTLQWTVPANAKEYRIKWSPKVIVDWLGFNAETYTYSRNPSTQRPWFSANNVTAPAPGTSGATQSVAVSTGIAGLAKESFSVKAYVGGTATLPPPPPASGTLSVASGNNQTGSVGTTLPTPFAAKVSDSGGNPVAGVTVTFAVTAGGGLLTTTAMATNTAGLAWTFLTLGATPGTNIVTATSGTLAGSPVTFTAVGAGSGPTITANQWVNVTPSYLGAPNGGQLTPMTCNNMGVYDPVSRRTIVFERWFDPIRSMAIYANSLVAYDPGNNSATVLKVNNWTNGYQPLPANATDPTPIDRHPLGGLALDPRVGAVYLVNGANQNGRMYYPDHPNDTWRLMLDSRSWSKLADAATDPHPPTDAGTYAGMVFDPPTGKLAYFVVQNAVGARTWLFDPASTRWSQAPADSSATNVRISAAGIAYDSRRNLVLAYGGGNHSDDTPSTKLWAYSVSQNKWTALRDAPIAATAPEFAYDSVHDVFLALVGTTTLIYNPRTNTWWQHPAVIARGANLNRQNVTYNPGHDVFVFEGGTWDKPVWSLFRYTDGNSTPPGTPSNLRIIR